MSSSIEDTFVVLSLLKKRKINYWVYPILKYRGRSSPSLSRSSGIITGDSKFTSGCQWLSFMLYWRCEPHIKNTFLWTQCARIYSALCCDMKWMNLTIAILDFGVCLYGGSELSKHLSQCLLRKQKTKKNKTDPKNFYDEFFLWGSVCNDL